MRVFLTGATGYVGNAVARAMRRAGHDVWGLTRDAAKRRALEAAEIHAVVGTLQEPAVWLPAAESCSVLIHAAADYQADVFGLDRKVVERLLEAGKSGARPKTVVYTSGVWVLGSTGSVAVDETAPPKPIAMVTPRVATEKLVLEASHVNGLVLRPGCVYGGPGGLTGAWFQAAYVDKAMRVVGDGENRWAMIHGDDLAEGYVRAAESGLGGEIFHLTDRSRSTVRQMAAAVARVAGYSGEIQFVPETEASKMMGPFAEAMAVDQHVDSRKAVRLLGWQPSHGGFLDGVETYFAAWKAQRP